ncbi:MAG TPA: hypothetical protein VLC08_07540 [Chitinolyticbacter sp.]|nr:hypothetical protein [Chitinolyticbacter sp.]
MSAVVLPPFPVNLWRSQQTIAELDASPCGLAALTVELLPFELDGATFETELRLDQIELPVDELLALAGMNLQFPDNPAPGYIDGSIYLRSRHHPVAVRELAFGQAQHGRLPLRITGRILPEPGTLDYAAASFVLESRLILPLSAADLPAAARDAIAACGASSATDVGRVMARLKLDPAHQPWLGELHDLVRRLLQARSS